MNEFDSIKLRQLDMSVLLIFLGLMRTRKAADVAGEFGLTPSSISHALRRLRDVFGDELFLRRPHGVEPTAFALHIEPHIRAAVEATEAALRGGEEFDPARSSVTVRIAAVDSALATMLPPVQQVLAKEAPSVTLQALPVSRPDILAALTDGALDIAIGVFPNHGDQFLSAPLYRDDYLVACRNGHRMMTGTLTLDRFLGEKHVLVAPRGDLTGVVDDALSEMGRQRDIVLTLPQFFPAFAILETSDLIGVLPSRLVRHFAQKFGLAHQAPPLDIRDFGVSALRHRRNARNPLHLWLVDKLKAAVRL